MSTVSRTQRSPWSLSAQNQDSDSEEDDSEEEDEISAVSPSKLAGPRASPTTDQHAKHSLHLEKLQKMVQVRNFFAPIVRVL